MCSSDLTIGIERLHMEEDAGKLVHAGSDRLAGSTHSLVDYNRAGVALAEIVSKPDLRTGREAAEYASEIRRIMRYLGVSDGNMQEGSLRCDVNISVRRGPDAPFGTKVEIKNMNSFSAIQKACEYEIQRQIKAYETGEPVVQETRLWDEGKQVTKSMRGKEGASDYRYFPDPDLGPIEVSVEQREAWRAELPELPELLRHPAYIGDIERRRVGEVGNFPYEMIASYPGYDEVVKMITVGDSALDAGLLGWLEQTVENGQSQQLENLWAAIFNVPGDHADMRRWLSGGGVANIDRVMALVIAYNIATYCQKHTLENTPLSLPDYDRVLAKLTSEIASRLYGVLEYTKRLDQMKTIFIADLPDGEGALVYAPVLNEYLQSGGDLGVVNAAVLFPKYRVNTVDDLVENQEDIRRDYASWQRQRTSEVTANRYERVLSSTTLFTRRFLQDRAEGIAGKEMGEAERARFLEQRMVCARKAISDLVRGIADVEQPVDTWSIAMKVVAGCFFEHTCALEIFNLISEELERNPELQP